MRWVSREVHEAANYFHVFYQNDISYAKLWDKLEEHFGAMSWHGKWDVLGELRLLHEKGF